MWAAVGVLNADWEKLEVLLVEMQAVRYLDEQ
jgi:hypothetical protein